MSRLLVESHKLNLNEEKLNELREDDKAGRPIVVVGIIQRADAKNQNGRIYPYDILRKEVDRYKNEVISQGNAIGELDHTNEPIIQLERASHVIEDLWWDGPDQKEVWGKIRLLSTPKGQLAKNIVFDGIPLGISSRAVGSVESRGDCDYVKEDLNLICWDLVGTPSTHSAYLKLHENKQLGYFNERKIYPAQYRIKDTLKDILGK